METGKTYAGIAFLVVYLPPSSTQVIPVQIDVDFGVAGSIETVRWYSTQIRVGFEPFLSACGVPFNSCSTTKLIGLLLGTEYLLGHFSCDTILSFIEGRVSGAGLCEHTFLIFFLKAITLLT